MLNAIQAALAGLVRRVIALESQGFNPYLPDADMFDHFAGDGTLSELWSTTLVGTGAVALVDEAPSLVRLGTGATAGSTTQIDWGARECLIGPSKWLDTRVRARIGLAVDNVADVRILILNTGETHGLTIGVIGSVSTGFFVARTIGVGVTDTITTVAIDTNWHDFRIQSFPDRIRYYIDNVLVAEHTTNVPVDTAYQPKIRAQNGATATARRIDVDIFWCREAR